MDTQSARPSPEETASGSATPSARETQREEHSEGPAGVPDLPGTSTPEDDSEVTPSDTPSASEPVETPSPEDDEDRPGLGDLLPGLLSD